MPLLISKTLSARLDSVRGAAALVVLIAHSIQWFVLPLVGVDTLVREISSSCAHIAVLIFFALSGFVISNSLVNNYQRNGAFDGIRYIRSRLARILPPAIFAVFFSLLIGGVILAFDMHGSKSFRLDGDLYVAREKISFNIQNIIATALLSNGLIKGTDPIITNGPLWSLSIEFWLYFIGLLGAVLLASFAKNTFVKDGYVAAVGLACFFLLMIFRVESFHQYFAIWMIGASFLLRKAFPELRKLIDIALIGIVLLGILCFAMKVRSGFHLWEKGLVIPIKLSLIIILTVLFFKLGKSARQQTISDAFRVLSKSSYSLYVLHFPVLCFLFSVFHKDFSRWSFECQSLFLLVISIVILWFSHVLARFLENKYFWGKMLDRIILLIRELIGKKSSGLLSFINRGKER